MCVFGMTPTIFNLHTPQVFSSFSFSFTEIRFMCYHHLPPWWLCSTHVQHSTVHSTLLAPVCSTVALYSSVVLLYYRIWFPTNNQTFFVQQRTTLLPSMNIYSVLYVRWRWCQRNNVRIWNLTRPTRLFFLHFSPRINFKIMVANDVKHDFCDVSIHKARRVHVGYFTAFCFTAFLPLHYCILSYYCTSSNCHRTVQYMPSYMPCHAMPCHVKISLLIGSLLFICSFPSHKNKNKAKQGKMRSDQMRSDQMRYTWSRNSAI
jgi:hypothetical protein